MHMKKWIALPALASAAAPLACLWLMCANPSSVPQAQLTVPPSAPQSPSVSGSPLFPGLNGSHITSLCVSTPERSFQFHTDNQGMVSVNGQQADGEIFSTLLEQIAELPAEHRSTFIPEAQDLILTLVISTDAKQQTAHFYTDGSGSETTGIVLDAGTSPEYRQTSIWRVGTLMMTCEGTRIQDAHGNETPVQQ